mmetsp:Transcript_12532/g.24358  ORF Transcript_12532/g.24358 Transcript_12532/m.24358 type:complete len:111 (+) Transcript_12532:315-647(+)
MFMAESGNRLHFSSRLIAPTVSLCLSAPPGILEKAKGRIKHDPTIALESPNTNLKKGKDERNLPFLTSEERKELEAETGRVQCLVSCTSSPPLSCLLERRETKGEAFGED